MQSFSLESMLVFLRGVGPAAVIPVPPPAFNPGNQPVDEKALNFPQVGGFHVEQSEPPIEIYGVGVTQ